MTWDPCKPTRPMRQCETCARRTERLPCDPERRPRIVAIDPSAVIKASASCPFRIEATPVRLWSVREPAWMTA